MIKALLVNHKLSEDEIQNLMDKKYCKGIFKKEIYYPVLDYSVDANKGKNTKIRRYYVNPVTVDGIDYYISSQWFDESRQLLIDWYKEKAK